MKGDFKTLLRKYCLESSVLGLKYFYLYPDPLSRCFWAVSIVSTIFMSVLLTLLLYNRFVDMPTHIAIENQYATIQNISFPAITMCSPNQITISAMKHFEKTLVDGNVTMDLKNILPRLLGFYELLDDTKPDDLTNLQDIITINRYNALEIMGLLPQKCEDFLKLCYLKNKLYPNCKGLFNPILTTRGMCCIFNSMYHYDDVARNGKLASFMPLKASSGGHAETLTVVTDYDPHDALSGTLLIAGANRVMFTDPSEFPADDESNMVQAHSESFHFIHATYTYCSEDVTTLPSTSRQCYFEDERHLPHFKLYRNTDCDLMCYVTVIERYCHCTMIYVPHIKLSRACNITSIDCIVKAKLEMNRLHNTDLCSCLRDCESIRYKVELSVGNLMALSDLTSNRYLGIKFNKSTSILHFMFQNSVHARQKQETVMSLITLSSNLGGIFGLCMGCSVISVWEIIFYIYCAIKNNIKRKLRKVQKNKIAYARYHVEFVTKKKSLNNFERRHLNDIRLNTRNVNT